jgi:hypothetical protein
MVVSVKYFRDPLLAFWIVVTVALAAILVLVASTPPVTTRPAVLSSSAAAVTSLSLDYADLAPAALYGGRSWINVVGKIGADAAAANTRGTSPAVSAVLKSTVGTAKVAAKDKTTADRWSDDVALSSDLDKLVILSGPNPAS